MGFHGECGRGWSARCANANPKGKCRCKCGGANHGKLRQTTTVIEMTREEQQKELRDAGKRHANFSVVRATAQSITIRDEGPWNEKHPTVTNDAEWVVDQVAEYLNGRRLYYFDSDGRLDEIVVAGGKFHAFAPCGLPLDRVA